MRRRLFVHSAMMVVVASSLVVVAPPASADHQYEQRTQMLWRTAELDVLVLIDEGDLVDQEILHAIRAWELGIDTLGPPWLSDAHQIRVYVPHLDPAPPPGYDGAEIVWAMPGGSATYAGYSVCLIQAPLVEEADTLGASALFRVAAHEFGHCLGLSHVFDHGVEYAPAFDLLGNGRDWACPSNLNIRVLEYAYGDLLGNAVQDIDTFLYGPPAVVMSSSEYFQIPDC